MIEPTRLAQLMEQLSAGQPVRHPFESGGVLHLDRALPFLCVYRGRDPATTRLLTSEAAYLLLSADRPRAAGRLVRELARWQQQVFGKGCVLEIWTGSEPETATPPVAFVVHSSREPDSRQLAEVLSARLVRMRMKLPPRVECRADRPHPPSFPPLLSQTAARERECVLLGLEITPVYRDPGTGLAYPTLLRQFRRRLVRALRQTFFEFTGTFTEHQPVHYHALGPRALTRAVWEVDRRLEEVADSFSFLLQVTPVNTHDAWWRFRRSGYSEEPRFLYRPFPHDAALLKRELYKVPVERVDDPTLASLFLDKQFQLDTKIGMLASRNTRRFLYGSLKLYGEVEPSLARLARRLLESLERISGSTPARVEAQAFARQARREIAGYRRKFPEFVAEVRVRDDLDSGILCESGHLLVGHRARLPEDQVMPLIHHEVGTHLLTFYNGQAQPLRLMKLGLMGFVELQEGLAVLAEHLSGGFNRDRLRLLAARVLSVESLLQGANFVETYGRIRGLCSLPARVVFRLVMRVFRGGGFTKDAVYLRGLVSVLEHLAAGGELEPLYLGKIGLRHLPLVGELVSRGVLKEPALLPRFLRQKEARQRLERLRQGGTIEEMLGLPD